MYRCRIERFSDALPLSAKRPLESEHGFALIAVMMMLSVLLFMLGSYSVLTRFELISTRFSSSSMKGFYAAEAGLNLRAEAVRQIFLGYNRPTGTSPTPGTNECLSGNVGSGDFACSQSTLGTRQVVSHITEDPSNPLILTIPVGERYQNLSAQEYRYTVTSKSLNSKGNVEAILELRFKSRLVPMFQFAAFYNKDLEILPGPTMTLAGPVHVNGDLYLNANTQLDLDGQVTTSGKLFRGRKNDGTCNSTPVRAKDPASWISLIPSCPNRREVTTANLVPWNGMIQRDVTPVDVPAPEVLDPTPGEVYWDKADIRLVLRLDGSGNPVTTNAPTGVEIQDAATGTANTASTTNLNNCTGSISSKPVGNSTTFFNNRENRSIRMLEVDAFALLNCVQTRLNAGGGGQILTGGRSLNDNTEGGLVVYLTVKGPNSNNASSGYGVRIRNAAALQSNVAGASAVRGITFVSNQGVYIHGNFNSTNKIPAAVLADAFNVLSTAWPLADTWDTLNVSSRPAGNTTINAAILSGTDTTGNAEGTGGQGGAYNGGLENYPRFHENWTGRTLTYYGSFVSLNKPRHSNGAWVYGHPQYNAPNRDWHYDTSFNDVANLPPLSPRFVYLRQQLFLREFEQG